MNSSSIIRQRSLSTPLTLDRPRQLMKKIEHLLSRLVDDEFEDTVDRDGEQTSPEVTLIVLP